MSELSIEEEKYFIGDDNTFLVESEMILAGGNKSFFLEKYRNSLRHMEGVKTVEMVFCKGAKLIFIEAKLSFPNPKNKESQPNIEKATQDIIDKFVHSLNLYCSRAEKIKQIETTIKLPQSSSVVFLLIIKGFNEMWCTPIVSKINEKLPKYIKKIWKPDVYVLNEKEAIKRGFVVTDIPIGAKIVNETRECHI